MKNGEGAQEEKACGEFPATPGRVSREMELGRELDKVEEERLLRH